MEEQTESHETWVVRLHLSNDHGLYLAACEVAADAYASWEPSECLADYYREDASRSERSRLHYAGDALAAFVTDELLPDLTDGYGSHTTPPMLLLASDLLTGALHEVDWHNVAESFLPEDPAERAELLYGSNTA